MNLKEELMKLRNKVTRKPIENEKKIELTDEDRELLKRVREFREGEISPAAKALADHFASIRSIYLDYKVDNFINWYYKNMVKGNYTDIGEYSELRELRNFIEKMAVWYELRYPSYEVNRLMRCCGQEYTEVSKEMFINNPYIKDFIGDSIEVKYLDWDEFYNTSSFIKQRNSC